MTAIRDRRSDAVDVDETATPSKSSEPAWDERSVLSARRGVPWWGAVLFALSMAVIGAFTDQLVTDDLSVIFHVCFLAGAIGAVLSVQRRSLFGPMVQPPLLMAITVPVVVLSASGLPEGSDMLSKALAIGTPLINSFPMMAIATVVTVALGLLRMRKQRPPATSDAKKRKPAAEKARDATPRRGDRTSAATEGRNTIAATANRKDGERVPDLGDDKEAGRPPRRDSRPRRRAVPGEDDVEAPRERRGARPPAESPPPKPPRERRAPERSRGTPDGERAPRGRPPADPDRRDPRRRGEGRAVPPGPERPERPARDRRVPPPPRAGGPRRDDPPRAGEQPPPGGRPAPPPRGVPRGGGQRRRDQPRGGELPRREGRPRGNRPPGGRPWDDDQL